MVIKKYNLSGLEGPKRSNLLHVYKIVTGLHDRVHHRGHGLFFFLVVASNSDKKGANVCFIVFSLFKTWNDEVTINL